MRTFRYPRTWLTGALLIFGIGPPALSYAQDPASITVSTGVCTSTVSGADIGCDGKQVITELSNGRTIVGFTGKDIATIGFAGGELQSTGGSHHVLWVDGVYVNQQKTAADGQCSVDRTAVKVSIDCRALLKDGRRIAATVTNASFKPAEPSQQAASPKPKRDCNLIVRTHAMLTRAQFQCRFSSYSNQMIEAARECSREIGEVAAKAALEAGFATFDRNEKERGHARLCAVILHDFSGVVRR